MGNSLDWKERNQEIMKDWYEKKLKEHEEFMSKSSEDITLESETGKKDFDFLSRQPHYDNSNGSLYKFAVEQGLNPYEFEVIKRIVRCRRKGEWISDIDKTIKVLELYKEEQGHLYKNETEPVNIKIQYTNG